MIIVRLAMGMVVGSTLAIIGYAIGWILALSVPEGVPRIPILISMTGLGAAIGTYLAWYFNIDGDSFANKKMTALILSITIIVSLIGGTIGHNYGAQDEGHRVRRYPEIQGTIWGSVGGANLMLITSQISVFAVGLALKKRELTQK